jgi:ATP/maltotriose-dependent transcriptional regulator MalT
VEILHLLDRGDRTEAASRIGVLLRDGSAEARDGSPADSARLAAVLRSLDRIQEAKRAVTEGRVADLAKHARAACTELDPALPWLAMYAGSLLQAAFRFTGDRALRDDALEALRPIADRVDVPEAAVPARAMMGSVHLLAGAYHATVEFCDAALGLARAFGLEDCPPAALAHQFRGYVLFEWNRLDEARDALASAWHASESGNNGVRSGVARVMAQLAAIRGETQEAEVWLERLEALVGEPMTLRNREWLKAVRIRHTIGTGDLRAIDEWLRAWDYRPETLAAANDLHLSGRLHELDGVLHLLEATERWSEVVALAPLIHRVAHDRRSWFDARALSTWAVALEARGLRNDAGELFNRALLAGDTGSFVRLYIDGNPIRVKLLERLAAADPANVHAHRVLGSAPELRSGVMRTADPLTDRQLAVLRLVEQGCSNKAIARELGVTLSTVKTHLRATFFRLDAVSRTQAIARARERGLL